MFIGSCAQSDNSVPTTLATAPPVELPAHVYIDNAFDPDHLPLGPVPLLELFETSAYKTGAAEPVLIEDSAAPTSPDLTTPSGGTGNTAYLGNILTTTGGTLIFDWTRCILFGELKLINAQGGTISGFLAGNQIFQENIPMSGAGSVFELAVSKLIDSIQIVTTVPTGISNIEWKEPETGVDSEQFEKYIFGETTFGGDRWNSTGNVAMVIDSATPPIGALGTPNSTFGGSGIGAGAGNNHARGKLMAITNGNTTAATVSSGTLQWYPFQPIAFLSTGIVNATGGTIDLYRDSVRVHQIVITDGGSNGYQLFKSNYSGLVDRVDYVFTNEAAVAGINYYGRVEPPMGFQVIETFDSFRLGEPNAEKGDWFTEDAIIFDTATTTQFQFASPHTDFAGTGVGSGGASGSDTQNDAALEKGLVNSLTSETPTPTATLYKVRFRSNAVVRELEFLGGNAGTVVINGFTYNLAQFGPNAVKTLTLYAKGEIEIQSENVLTRMVYEIDVARGVCTGTHSISDITNLQNQIDNLQTQIDNKPDDLDELGDTTIAAPSAGQILQWNGAAWVNATDVSLYSLDGTISGNRVADMTTNTLRIGSATNNINIDAGTGDVELVGTNTTQVGGGATTINGATVTVTDLSGGGVEFVTADATGLLAKTATVPNFYGTNGTLAGPRSVAGGGNTLEFTGLSGFEVSTTSGNITLSPNGDVDADTNKIVNVVDPTANQDAATKKYVDDQIAATTNTNIYNTDDTLTGNRTVTVPVNTNLSIDGGLVGSGAVTVSAPTSTFQSSVTTTVSGPGNRRMVINVGNGLRLIGFNSESIQLTGGGILYTTTGGLVHNFSGGDLFINSNKVTSVADPTAPQDAATKNYVDTNNVNTNLANTNLTATGNRTFSGSGNSLTFNNMSSLATTTTGNTQLTVGGSLIVNSTNSTSFSSNNGMTFSTTVGGITINPINELIDAGTSQIINVKDPTAAQHAATKAYVDAVTNTNIANANLTATGNRTLNMASNNLTISAVNTFTLSGGSIIINSSGDISFSTGLLNVINVNNKKITNLANPTGNQDAATKKYVDDEIGALFGSEYASVFDDTTTTAGGLGWATAITLNVVVSGGPKNYRVGWYSEFRNDGTGTNAEARCYWASATTEIGYSQHEKPFTSFLNWESFSGHRPLVLNTGAHSFQLQVQSQSGATQAYMRRMRLEFWRT